MGVHADYCNLYSDKYHKKNMEFYRKRIPCNMVMINEEGDVDLIKQSAASTPADSPAPFWPTPRLMVSEKLDRILEEEEQETDHLLL